LTEGILNREQTEDFFEPGQAIEMELMPASAYEKGKNAAGRRSSSRTGRG